MRVLRGPVHLVVDLIPDPGQHVHEFVGRVQPRHQQQLQIRISGESRVDQRHRLRAARYREQAPTVHHVVVQVVRFVKYPVQVDRARVVHQDV